MAANPTKDIWAFAMQMEVDGRNFYLDLAAKAKNEGVKEILRSLADDELKHYKLFEHLSHGTGAEVTRTGSLQLSLNVFQRAVANRELYDRELIDAAAVQEAAEVYRKAIKVEQDSWAFYEEKAKEVTPEQARVLRTIAAEEKLHEKLLYQVLEWITRPDEWIACAEFSHIGEPAYGAGAE